MREQDFMDVDVYDETDYAQWMDLASTAKAIEAERNRSKTNGMSAEQIAALIEVSPTDCQDCGEAIDPRRRIAQPGVELCVDCKEYNERKDRVNGIKH